LDLTLGFKISLYTVYTTNRFVGLIFNTFTFQIAVIGYYILPEYNDFVIYNIILLLLVLLENVKIIKLVIYKINIGSKYYHL